MNWLITFATSDTALPFLQSWALRGALVLGVTTLVVFLVRHQSAAVRHGIWAAGIFGMLALPVLAWTLPAWEVLPTRVTGSDRSVPVPQPQSVVSTPAPETPYPPTLSRVQPVVPSEAPPASPAVQSRGLPESAVGAPNPNVLVTLWLAGVALVLGWLGVALVRLTLLESRARRFLREDWHGAMALVAEGLGVRRHIRLFVSSEALTPMTWGIFTPVILLPSAAARWSPDRRRDVLLHEIAHIRRYDFLTQLIARVACALMWFNPLVWIAARRLRLEREQACDDAVIASGARPSEYAGHLLEIARNIRSAHAAEFAAVAMARRSQLSHRVSAVLAEDRQRNSQSPADTTMTWALTAALLIPIATAQTVVPREPVEPPVSAEAVEPAGPPARAVQQVITWASAPSCREGVRGGSRSGTSENVNDARRVSAWWDDGCEGSATLRGDVEFTSDFRDVVRMDRGARFELEIDDGEVRRSIELRERNGSIQRRWYVDGDQRDYDANAETWLGRALVDYFRHSNYKMDARVARLLESGVSALMDEAAAVHGGYLKRRYYAAAIESGQLNPTEIAGIVRRAADDVASDHEMGRLLNSIPADAMRNQELRGAYLQAANTLESDFERARVLSAMLEQENLDRDLMLALLRSAGGMESDFEVARLLLEVSDRFLGDPGLQAAYLDVAAGVGSDFQQQRVLRALVDRPDLPAGLLAQLLGSASSIDSDFELSRLLARTVELHRLEGQSRTAFFHALRGVDSDHEQGQVLSALARRDNVDAETIGSAIEAMRMVDSDHTLAQLVLTYQRRFGSDESVRDALIRIADDIDSDYEHRRVMDALRGRRRTN